MRGKRRRSQETGSIISSISCEFILSFVSPSLRRSILHQEFCKYSAAMSLLEFFSVYYDSPSDRRGLPLRNCTPFLMYYACPVSIFIPHNGNAAKAGSHGKHVQPSHFTGASNYTKHQTKRNCLPFDNYLGAQMHK